MHYSSSQRSKASRLRPGLPLPLFETVIVSSELRLVLMLPKLAACIISSIIFVALISGFTYLFFIFLILFVFFVPQIIFYYVPQKSQKSQKFWLRIYKGIFP